MTDLRTRCLNLADELADFPIDSISSSDLELALEGLTEDNLYATAEVIVFLNEFA